MSAGTDSGREGFLALAELSRRHGRGARSLPAQTGATPTRTAVCFRLQGGPVAILLDELGELLEVPRCTRLPGVKSWVRGIANVRGRLIPLIDFAAFLGERPQAPDNRQRVLLIERDGVAAGLVVDEVVGMKHFRVDSYSEERETVPPGLARFVPGTFVDNGEHWPLFRPEALFGHQDFLDVAA